MAAGESPKVAISSPAYCGLRLRRHQDPRAAGGARGAAEVVRGASTKNTGASAWPAWRKLKLQGETEGAGAAERQKTLAAQDGKCALCGCGLTGACELDHVVPVRQAFAGSVQTLQALCGDCHSEKTLRESAQPTSLESRVASGVMEYVRSPKLPPLVFEAQTCAKDSTYVGVDASATGWPTLPSRPSCARRTALSPWTACRTWALWRAAAMLPYVGPG